VTRIGPESFVQTGITGITLPGTITSIGYQAFNGGTLLENVTIPSSITNIETYAFADCPSLSAVYFLGNAPTADCNVFNDDTDLILFHLPGTTGWTSNYDCTQNALWASSTLGFEAVPFGGGSPLTVQYSSSNQDSAGSDIVGWNWSFGDGGTSNLRSPLHSYTNAGIFYPHLYATNSTGALVVGLGPSPIVVSNLTMEYTASLTNVQGPLMVNFESGAVDNLGQEIVSWKWDFGDGYGSASQDPSHSYTTSGVFYPALIATDSAGGEVLGVGPAWIAVGGDLLNGGFESGDFTNWAIIDSSGNSFVDDGSISGLSPHTGRYFAALGGAGAVSYLSQSFITLDGKTYLLSFWFENPNEDTGQLSVSWDGGTPLVNINVDSYTNWTKMQFQIPGTGEGATLQFAFEDDNWSWFGLDDISVIVAGPTVAFTADPSNGVVPLTVSFTAAGVDNAGNSISSWNWSFGDGSISTAQNPTHTYSAPGAFFPVLTAINNVGETVTGSGLASITATSAPVNFGLVINGGFETGDFTGWNLSGPDTNDLFVDNGFTTGIDPHSGNFFAALGSTNSLSYISQMLATTPGTAYSLSFWVNSPDGSTPNEFLASWNGNTLFDQMNLPEITGWTNLHFAVVATGSSTVLQFGSRDDPSYLGLDDVSVLPVQGQLGIGSLAVSGTKLVLNGLNGQSGGTYYVLMTTNLLLPLSEWVPVATNVLGASGNFTVIVTNTVTPTVPQRYYILESP
jgi:PKD repeat protein